MFPSLRQPASEVPARVGRHEGQEYQSVAIALVGGEHTDAAGRDGHRGRTRRCLIPSGTTSHGA